MLFVCLGYHDEAQSASQSEEAGKAMIDKCLAYDDELRRIGSFIGGHGLQDSSQGATLRWVNGKTRVTDGPYAETKEQIGGILLLEARDLEHAIELMSKHPGVQIGPFEIRPAADLTEMIRESEERRATQAQVSS